MSEIARDVRSRPDSQAVLINRLKVVISHAREQLQLAPENPDWQHGCEWLLMEIERIVKDFLPDA